MNRGVFMKFNKTFLTTTAVLLLSLTLAFLPQYSFASSGGKITGRVTEKSTGDPMPGVNVQLVGVSMGAATDGNGEYYILNIPPGTYDIKASIIGYKTIIQTGVEVSVNHTTQIDFRMEETVIELNESVVVTAERPLVEKDLTSSRHFVSAEEIAVRPTTDFAEILSTLPGIDRDASGELSVRRGSIDQVAFLIDGMRASNPLNYQPYTNINLSSIQELEIITGAFNAEYGQAQSGVFNIVTKEGSQKFSGYAEMRYIPAHIPHWGTSFYDYSTTRYWENSNARHLQWWIDHPDQWVDLNGTFGNDPGSQFSPEEAYQYYMDTHKPLNDYTNEAGYQTEISLGGPTPLRDLFFFISGKYKNNPPVTGNSYRNRGTWLDGTAKLTFNLTPQMKFMVSGFYGEANTNAGMEYMNFDFMQTPGLGLLGKYSYFDLTGYPENKNDGETLQFTHVLGQSTFYVLQFSRIFNYNSQSTFPGDENGWNEASVIYDNLRAVDSLGNEIPGAYDDNIIGLHSTGYYYRGHDKNTDLTFSGDLTSQLSQNTQIKAGGDFTYYILNRYQEAKAYRAIEDNTYHPFEGNIYGQAKLEFEGLIINAGLRFDFYNPNDKVYLDTFDPLGIIAAGDSTTPNPKTEPTTTFSQLSPRLGISHPISENTVLHFSYGHFFQRANFGDYGEGYDVSGILNTYITDPASGSPVVYNLGNRDLKPRKTVEYELGVEHNISGLVFDITAYYKDITQTVRTVTVTDPLTGVKYKTSGNGDYGDSKGVEISIRKPLSNYWGGYFNYTYTTGINGISGDPTTIYPPGWPKKSEEDLAIGDQIVYDEPKLKFGLTFVTPGDLELLGGIFKDMQFSIDYQIYYPNKNIPSDVLSEAGVVYEKAADKNADIRVRKEIDFGFIRPALFVEIKNAFNDTWSNLSIFDTASPEDRVNFINSGMALYPAKQLDGSPFPDMIMYRNLPRQITFGISFSY
jgi:outer membrane receptor protein involved in Fe transport